MAYISPYGKADGLSERLLKFADTFASDKRYPWAGLGIIDDLRAAAAVIDGRAVPPTLLEEMEAEDQLGWDL
jgi:hypothetical protein